MAVSTSNNLLDTIAKQWADEFDLSEVSFEQDIETMTMAIRLRRGKNQMMFKVDASLFGIGDIQRGLRAVKDQVYIAQKKLPQNRLDLRYNAIEGMNDFLTLVSREREKNPNEIDTVVLTPEQSHLLQREAMQNVRPDLMGQPILTIYGYTVETRGQD